MKLTAVEVAEAVEQARRARGWAALGGSPREPETPFDRGELRLLAPLLRELERRLAETGELDEGDLVRAVLNLRQSLHSLTASLTVEDVRDALIDRAIRKEQR